MGRDCYYVCPRDRVVLMHKHRDGESRFFSLGEFRFLFWLYMDRLRLPYIPLGEDQAIRSSFLRVKVEVGAHSLNFFFFCE